MSVCGLSGPSSAAISWAGRYQNPFSSFICSPQCSFGLLMLDNQNSQHQNTCIHCSYHDVVVTVSAYMRNTKQHSTGGVLESTWDQRRQVNLWRLTVHYVSISDDEFLFFQVKPQRGLAAINSTKIMPVSRRGSTSYRTYAHSFNKFPPWTSFE